MADTQTIPPQTNPIVLQSAPINEIARAYNLLNLPNILPPQTNQFDGKIQSNARDKQLYLSPLGTPVMQDITFDSAFYTDNNTGQQRTTTPLKLINILLTVSQSKKIITTYITGRDGAIKEYIGMDDYEITINGIITGTNGNHPADQIIALKNTLIAGDTTPVICAYLNNLDILNVVIKDFTLDQEVGGYSKQGFTINCLSDIPIIMQMT